MNQLGTSISKLKYQGDKCEVQPELIKILYNYSNIPVEIQFLFVEIYYLILEIKRRKKNILIRQNISISIYGTYILDTNN